MIDRLPVKSEQDTRKCRKALRTPTNATEDTHFA